MDGRRIPGRTMFLDAAGAAADIASMRVRGATRIATLAAEALAAEIGRTEGTSADIHRAARRAADLLAASRPTAVANRVAPGAGSAETVPGSHHKEAVLVFPRPADGTVVLVLEGLGGVPERRLVFA